MKLDNGLLGKELRTNWGTAWTDA